MTRHTKLFRSKLSAELAADTEVEELLLREYGSVFVAGPAVVAPRKIVFADQADVLSFQESVEIMSARIGGFQMELQAAAMQGLLSAISEAEASGLTVSPRAADSARRDYDGTVELWKSRVEPALDHWVKQGKLNQIEADHVRSLSPFEQVPVVLGLEAKGLWFAKDLSKSIIYSVAPPGTSQHLAMLAFDVREFGDARVREILARNGWFQTVVSDLPHFTYLGVTETDLTDLGLKRVMSGEQTFWVPDL
jgi:hypothetical protein